MAGLALALIERDWVDPLHVAAGLEQAEGRLILLSDGGPSARWSYVAAQPERLVRIPVGARDPFAGIEEMCGDSAARSPDAPPFAGGVVGLASYDLGAPAATLGGDDQHWPGLTLVRHRAVLAFDHHRMRVIAVGRGETAAHAAAAAATASGWLARARAPHAILAPLAESFVSERPEQAYRDAVADVVARIAAGEIFQANVARAWSGTLAREAEPFDLFVRLADLSPAPYAAFWDLGDHVLASNSPESFLSLCDGGVVARPIKGTRPRGSTREQDEALKSELLESAKDRAENLMIVDLMRNDLSRICAPGSVSVPALFELQTFANVHHLVSTVQGRLASGIRLAEVMAATFPPGSITGAPKHQAMQVIARHEAARGPWCGSLFLAGFDGSLEASVLIRTIALRREADRWRFRTLAGAGVVADSDPGAELAETEAKVASIRRALMDHWAPSTL